MAQQLPSRKAPSAVEYFLGTARRHSARHGSPQPSPLSAAALPTINNYILQKHIDAVHALQQELLENELRCRTSASFSLDEVSETEDDAPLPSTRYKHMSDMLLPDQEPETLDAWKEHMEQQLQQRLVQQQQQQKENQLSPA